MPIACVLVTHLPVKLELLRQPRLHRSSLVVAPSGSRKTVLDHSPEAKGVARTIRRSPCHHQGWRSPGLFSLL